MSKVRFVGQRNTRFPAQEQRPQQAGSLLEAICARQGPSSHVDVKELDGRLRQLIADQENSNLSPGQGPISPEDISVEYILNERRRRVYPKIRYEIHSPYGGYGHSGVRSITREEIDALAKDVESRMAHF